MVMHDIAWHCMALHGFAWYCIVCMVLHGIAWYCIVLHGITWYCMVLHGITWYWLLLGIAWYIIGCHLKSKCFFVTRPLNTCCLCVFGVQKKSSRFQTSYLTDRAIG